MKKFFLITFSVLLLWSCGSKNQYKINGEVIPSKEGKVILYGFKDGQPIGVDSCELKNSKFSFKGEIDVPALKLIGFEGEQEYAAQMFVEAGKINMVVYPDSFQSNTIEGSASQDIFKTYIDEMISLQKKENELQQRFQSAQMSGNTEEIDAIRFEYQTIFENNRLYSKNFINKHSSSPVAAYVYLMNFIQEADVQELDSMLNIFEPIKDSEFVTVIKDRADAIRLTSTGAVAPDFTLADEKGNPQSISSLRGKIVLIDFWASWCQPCMVELPNVIELYKNSKDKGFEILGVSLDREKDAWLNCIKDNKMDWIQVWDMEENNPGQVATKYNVTGIPHTVLVDKEGKIVAVNLRGAELAAKVAELLK